MKPMKYIRLYENFNIGLFAIIDSNKKNKNIEDFLKTHPGEIVDEDNDFIRIRYTWHNDFNIDVPYKWKWSFFEINKLYPFLTHTFRKNKIDIITSKYKNYLLNNLDLIKKSKKYTI